VLRLLLFTTFFFINSYSAQNNFKACQQKIIDSKSLIIKSITLPIENKIRLVFSEIKPNAKVLKFDPYLNLYLLEDRSGFNYPFNFSTEKNKKFAVINNKTYKLTKIIDKQVGLNSLAHLGTNIKTPAIITTNCCQLEAFVTSQGVIEKEYLEHFVFSKESNYATVGIRVKSVKNIVEVSSINPFFKNNPFLIGDKILSLDGTRVKNISKFMRTILFSPLLSKHYFRVKREEKELVLSVITQRREGGGFLSDTFLEKKGIYFNEMAEVIELKKRDNRSKLKVGDKVVKVNGYRINSSSEIRKYISQYEDFISLLVERDGFQFFVKIN